MLHITYNGSFDENWESYNKFLGLRPGFGKCLRSMVLQYDALTASIAVYIR